MAYELNIKIQVKNQSSALKNETYLAKSIVDEN